MSKNFNKKRQKCKTVKMELTEQNKFKEEEEGEEQGEAGLIESRGGRGGEKEGRLGGEGKGGRI